MALTKVRTGGITADAVDNTILDLADDFAFTGTVSGTITTLNSGGLSLSGNTEADIFNLPSGIKRIIINFRGVSVSSSDNLQVQLGTSSGLTGSGYASISHYGSGGISVTSGFGLYGVNNTNILSGIMTIAHMGSNIYVSSHSAKYNTSNGVFGGGDVSLSGTLDRLRIRPTGSNTFDAGSLNIFYEL